MESRRRILESKRRRPVPLFRRKDHEKISILLHYCPSVLRMYRLHIERREHIELVPNGLVVPGCNNGTIPTACVHDCWFV